jgi:rhamnulokinase
MSEKIYLAIDLGAESGRVIAGRWNGKTVRLQEIHRFPNGPVYLGETMRWDVLRLWGEIQAGLALAARQFGRKIVSVGADTWGVDFVLLSRRNELLGLPYHYRDPRTNGALRRAFRVVPRRDIFAQTGLQFMQLNTLFQLLELKRQSPELLEQADVLVMMADFFHWALCGARVVEFTNGSTTQCLNPVTRRWASELLARFELPAGIFPKIVPPGTNLGRLRESVATRTGLGRIRVVAPPTHDTASAVAAVPTPCTGRANWGYLSSGTWSLLGTEIRQASLAPRTLALNLTNEGGVEGTYRLLKNIMGLWLIQQCKRSYDQAGRTHTYAELEQLAAAARPLRSLINPDDPRFLNPPDMPRAIQDFCRHTGQPVPRSIGELVRCARESLALRYRQVLGFLEEVTRETVEAIHIVGGGSKDRLLNQMTADACQRPVLAGPVEATALGNLLMQAKADGELGSLTELRAAVRASAEVTRFEPASPAPWDEAAARMPAG